MKKLKKSKVGYITSQSEGVHFKSIIGKNSAKKDHSNVFDNGHYSKEKEREEL